MERKIFLCIFVIYNSFVSPVLNVAFVSRENDELDQETTIEQVIASKASETLETSSSSLHPTANYDNSYSSHHYGGEMNHEPRFGNDYGARIPSHLDARPKDSIYTLALNYGPNFDPTLIPRYQPLFIATLCSDLGSEVSALNCCSGTNGILDDSGVEKCCLVSGSSCSTARDKCCNNQVCTSIGNPAAGVHICADPYYAG